MAKRKSVNVEECHVTASRKTKKVAPSDEGPDNPSSKPHAAKRHGDDLDELFGSRKRHKSDPSAAEEVKCDEEGDQSDETEQQQNGKRKGEVDVLFAKLKKHRAAKAEKQVLRKQILGKRKAAGSKDNIFGRGITKARRRDVDGFAIYSEEELGISKGGNTPQCPFDCECCF